MNKLIISMVFFLSIFTSYAQVDFKWEKIDSVKKTKSQIYSDTKLFIAETWKSAQNVIQNDDKDAGVILVKAVSLKNCVFRLNTHYFTFSYTMKFYMKEGKYKIDIENVRNTSHTCGTYTWENIQPVDNFEGNNNLSAKKGNEIFSALKSELQSIMDNYEEYIKRPSAANSDW